MGVIMKAFNAVHFGHKLEFIFEFIPQLVLLLALFGFMDFMIISKWLIDWQNYPGGKGQPPSIVSQMIDMTIKGGVLTGSELVEGQVSIMQHLLVIAAVCLPIMLCVRPCYEGIRRSRRAASKVNDQFVPSINEAGPGGEGAMYAASDDKPV